MIELAELADELNVPLDHVQTLIDDLIGPKFLLEKETKEVPYRVADAVRSHVKRGPVNMREFVAPTAPALKLTHCFQCAARASGGATEISLERPYCDVCGAPVFPGLALIGDRNTYVCLEGEVANDLSEVVARIGALQFPLEEVGVWCQDHYRGQSGGRRPTVRYDQIRVREMPAPDWSVQRKAEQAEAFVRGRSYDERLQRRTQLEAIAARADLRSSPEIELERLVLNDPDTMRRNRWEWKSRAVVCDSYVVPFSDRKNRLIIEVDDPRKNRDLALAGDRVKDAHLRLAGYDVLRIWDARIKAAAANPAILADLRDSVEQWFAERTSARKRARQSFLEECGRYDAMLDVGFSEQIAEQAARTISLSPDNIWELAPLTAWERDVLWSGSFSAESVAKVQAVRSWEASGYSHAQALLAAESEEAAEHIRRREERYSSANFADEASRDFALDPDCDPDDLDGLSLSESEIGFLTRLRPTPESVDTIRLLRNLVASGASGEDAVVKQLAVAKTVNAIKRFESESRWRSIGYTESDLIDVLHAGRPERRTWRYARDLLKLGLDHANALRFAMAEKCAIGDFRSLAPFATDEVAFLTKREAAPEVLQDIDRIRSLVGADLCTREEASAILAGGAASEVVSQFTESKHWQSRGFTFEQAQEATRRKLDLQIALAHVASYHSLGFSEDASRIFAATGCDPAALADLQPLPPVELEYLARNGASPQYQLNIRMLRETYVPEGVAYVLQRDCSHEAIREAARFAKLSAVPAE